ncbi:MAG: RHS repeat-associated core domain-containing protein [Acidobacteriota bacterium]|nr:RHS repeat-associated core domain-containing protein [Acidobacteriota bacterium]
MAKTSFGAATARIVLKTLSLGMIFSIISRSVRLKLVSLLLIISFLSASTPAAPETIKGIAINKWQDARFAFLSGGYTPSLPTWLATFIKGKGKSADRTNRTISRIQIYPGALNILQGQETAFSAVAFDSQNQPINGVPFDWTITDVVRARAPRRLANATFDARRAGTYLVKVRAANGVMAEVPVVVAPFRNVRPVGTPVYQISSRTGRGARIDTPVQTGAVEGPSKESTKDADTEDADKDAPKTDIPAPTQLQGEQWDDSNWLSADDPGNLPGNPPGGPLDGGAGNGNFQISAPVISLPGRGIDLALNLNYNSRLWSKANSQITYDIDYGYPAPGWNLGFGRIMSMGSQGGCMMLDADGTRHGYTGSLSTWQNGMTFTGHTADGTFIDYGCTFNYGSYGSAWAKLPNGTTISYATITPGNGHALPTQITDAQGNYITITYRNNPAAQIETVTDTMGRAVTFNYDSLNRLISIDGPRFEMPFEPTTRTLVRIHYKPLTLNYSFSGITPIVRQQPVHVIDAIYYPATNTGYWFGDTDSYSSYGMITKVVEKRGMEWSPGSEEQGTFTKEGSMTKQAVYNYPLTTANETGRTNGAGLTDAPTYTKLTESWAGRDVEEDAITEYTINNNDWKHDGTTNSPARSITVKQPNGVISRQYSYRTPNAWTDGLVFTDETVVMNGSTEVVVASSLVSWLQGNQPNNLNYDSPRPGWAKVFDENGDYVKTAYTYGTNKFNQITRSCDYDDSETLLRCSNAEYENDPSYIGSFSAQGQFQTGRHLFNLVRSTSIEDAGGNKVSKTDYEYDNYSGNALQDAPGVIRHNQRSNPYTTELENGACLLWDPPNGEPSCSTEGQQVQYWCGGGYCEGYCECQEYDQVSVYDPATDKRGNVTKVTTYADAQNLTGAVYETRGYDITGNLVKSSTACCEQTSFTYNLDTHYAYPISQTRGAADPNSPHRITTSAIYDYNTGLVKQTTDANGRSSTTEYNPDTLRPVMSMSSTFAFTTFSYDDEQMTVAEEVKDANGILAGKSKKYLNGVGQVRKVESDVPGGTDVVETQYNKFGQEWKQSRPYRSGEAVYWSERFYDLQGRLFKVQEPDGSMTQAIYNPTGIPSSATTTTGGQLPPGNRILVKDAWGRERWGRYDQQGRLVEVVEPNPDAAANPGGKILNENGTAVAGSLVTKYLYNTLGRLVETNQFTQDLQTVQVRKFRYDDLGRLTRQKLAEQTATLNDAGVFVGAGPTTGANWSEAFFYDNRSNLIQKTDPRGVKTHFSYQLGGGGDDPLNRLQSRTYDTSGPLQPGLPIHNTWGTSVSYEYMTTGDKSRVKKITTANLLTEEYGYDPEGRVSEYKQTVNYRESYPMTVNYLYDTLNRIKETTYPDQYGTGIPRKIVEHSYDTASRLSMLKFGGVQQAGTIAYNASDQTTSINIGPTGANQVNEQYTFDPQTGLLTKQKALQGTTELLNLDYDYSRGNSVGSGTGKTGHLTKVVDNLNTNKNKEYEFDALGRLMKAKGGVNGALWDQQYSYDRYGNRTDIQSNGNGIDGNPIPLDGIPDLTYDQTSNRITTTGFEYDVAGNQISGFDEQGNALQFEYDAANRIVVVKRAGNSIQSFMYGSTNARLMDIDHTYGPVKIFASVGGTVFSEYTEFANITPSWTKSYTYLGDSQLATITPNGTSGGNVEYNHPDRLGTRLVTNQATGGYAEQAHLPFGKALASETSLGFTNNKRFTSYDRSAPTGLDYAVNRTYDSKQGRFTQVDPIGIKATTIVNPQTLNLYNYCGNDPVNHTDPDGLFWGFFKKLFKWIGKHLKKIFTAIAIVVAVVTVIAFPWSGPVTIKAILGLVAALASAASSVFDLAGLKTLSKIFGIVAMVAGVAALGFEVKDAWQKLKKLGTKVFSFADDPPVIYETVTVNIGGFWDALTTTISAYSNQVSVALGLSNLSLPFEAKSGLGGKNPYGQCDSFSGVNAQHMYRNGGEGAWGREVRGMLLAEYTSPGGATAFGAHVRSYLRATVRNPTSAPGGISKAVLEAGKSIASQASTRVAEGVNSAMNLGYSGGSNAGFTCRFDVN